MLQATDSPQKLRILVVEDDLIDRLQVLRAVEKTDIDCSFDEALSLNKARELLVMKTYDVILLDNHLPDGYGAKFARDITESGLSKGARIVMLTGEVKVAEAVAEGHQPWQHVLDKDDFSFRKLREILLERPDEPIEVATAEDCVELFKLLANDNLPEALETLESLNEEVWGRIDSSVRVKP
ncbi:response regulator [Pseudoponticoccus marisrubri]|uniref:Response regulatory domain-containing protein n=1 Tax=Pseudoponticoccus marisrubri TaxID=1685382 RepID=A0A0W7WML3_9RHOB|nr:response regulator [Pseudoponticoccus marisrubri]KUF11791.1 hypothetical protein AVJ23_04190 [Pseudoponticoccus marisrubri]